MKRYRLDRAKAPLRPWPAGAKVVGGDDQYCHIELPDGADVPDLLEPMGGPPKKAKKDDEIDPAEDE